MSIPRADPLASRRWPLLRGVLPVGRPQVTRDVLAGVTLAALGIPEVLGYAKIAGMPVVTGLYTLLIPMAVFAVLGSSRHLVVGADSATAAILSASLVGLAVAGSTRYVALAGLATLLTGGLLLLARLTRLGFLGDFLSRTVLVGFLTGVGVQVAVGQIPDMLGVSAPSAGTLGKLGDLAHGLSHVGHDTLAVAVVVVLFVVVAHWVTPRIPGALIAVVGAVVVSRVLDLAGRGVPVLGPVPQGVPHLQLPDLAWHDGTTLVGAAASMFVVVLAQSAATARAYAARYDESLDEDADLTALGAANVAAAFSGTFVVNGSPTKTEMVDGAGGRTQLAPLTTAAVVLVVLLLLTGPLASLPNAALAAIVFLIGVRLVDVTGMRRILAVRRDEFAVALLTAAAVVTLGVEDGIIVAVVVSVIDHLRHSYRPRNSVLAKSPSGHWQASPAMPGARTEDGVVVYRFGTSMYYANASRLLEDLTDITGQGPPVRWLILDGAAIGDIDYTAANVLSRTVDVLQARQIRLVLSSILDPVRGQLDRYGITAQLDADACYDTPGEALEAFHRTTPSP